MQIHSGYFVCLETNPPVYSSTLCSLGAKSIAQMVDYKHRAKSLNNNTELNH